MFVTGPELMLDGVPIRILLVTVTAGIGIWALTAAVVGHAFGDLATWERSLFLAAAVALISPETLTDLLAVGVLAPVVARRVAAQRRPRRRDRRGLFGLARPQTADEQEP
jgi:TRAP-type uncharacterized transport system fused permease subunit